jgi:hypothetical protein
VGETDVLIAVPVFGDTLAEADETFFLALTGAVGASIDLATDAVGTILDDDPLPQLAVGDLTAVEGDPDAPSAAVFTVSTNAPSGQTVSVVYATQQGTATAGEDFTYTSGTLDLPPGTTSATVSVPVLPDLQVEDDETFHLLLFSPVNATLADDMGTATVLNDDTALGFYTVTPCRLLDTRQGGGPALGANVELDFAAAGACGIAPTARAVAVIVASVAPTDPGYLQLYASGTAAPNTSILNFGRGQTRTSNTIARVGANGAVTVQCRMPPGSTGAAHVVVDVFGYFR